jgi:hypothetical protein
MKFSYRLYREGGDVLLAISDSSIIGKTFEEGDVTITVGEFYQDKTCDSSGAVDLVKSSTIVNAIGKDIVSLLIAEKYIDKDSVLIVSGVPHAQIITVQ